MFKHLRLSALTQKIKYLILLIEPILTHSTLAAGIVQDTFAGDGEEETTGGYFYHYFYRSG